MNNVTMRMLTAFVLLCAGLVIAITPREIFAAETVCAEVKIEIKQELTLERQAFDAMMRINNTLDTIPLEDVRISVLFTDETGNGVIATNVTVEDPTAKFFIRENGFTGIDTVTDSILEPGGTVAPATTAEIHWLIIPTSSAAENLPGGKVYFVGAHLTYSVGGEPEEIIITPDFITVKPLPQLSLDYFLPRDVVGDDPQTTTVVEPVEPFNLGVRVKNNAIATATNVSIDSAQPKIVENKQGLLIDFKLIGSSVQDQPVNNTLLINFGDIPGNSSKAGRWIMTSSLSGEFTAFDATISHADELGGELTSIIKQSDVHTHRLVRDVRVDLPGRDRVRDFLAFNDAFTILRVFESDSVLSIHETASPQAEVTQYNATSAALAKTGTSGSDDIYALTTNTPPPALGYVYYQFTDPYNGAKAIKSVVRSDGKAMLLDNAWTSRVRNRDGGPDWYYLNVFDVNSTGSYTVRIGDPQLGNIAPTLNNIPNTTLVEGSVVDLAIQATDSNNDPITLSATNLPTGAQFTDSGNGSGAFHWVTAVGQAGKYTLKFTASDGKLSNSRSVTLTVNPQWDTDGDGLDDDWERLHFNDLSKDGTLDSDGDGISDLDEYLNGWDPNLAAPAPPGGFAGQPGNLQNFLSWDAATGVTSYNLYWNDISGVDSASATKITGVTSPFTHSGLVNGQIYYYALTAVGAGGESQPSTEISVIPGVADWGVPQRLEDSVQSATEPSIATDGNGNAVAVWAQSDGTASHLYARRYTPTGGWGLAEQIEFSGAGYPSAPRVVLHSDGSIIVAWLHFLDAVTREIRVNHYNPTTLSWGVAQTLSDLTPGLAYAPQLAMDAGGNAIIAWQFTENLTTNNIWLSRYTAGGTWDAAAALAASTTEEATDLALAMSANGDAIIAWVANNGTRRNALAAHFTPTGGWDTLATPLETIDLGDTDAPHAAMNTNGDGIVVWHQSDGVRNSVWANHFSPLGGWSGAELVETNDLVDAQQAVAAINDNNEALVVWQQHDGATIQLWASRYNPVSAAWGTATRVDSSDRGNTSVAQLHLENSANGMAIWSQHDGARFNLWAARYIDGIGWQSPQIIETDNSGNANPFAIAAGGDSAVYVVWQGFDGTQNDIWFNAYLQGNPGMPNIAPIAVSDIVMTVNEGALVTINGTASWDQDGSIATYLWERLSGPVTAITDVTAATTTLTAPLVPYDTSLLLQLTVTDDQGATHSVPLSITVKNVNPDDDADGMDDAWELQFFGSLVLEGSTDFDNDGFSDLQEYLQGTNPTLSTPTAPVDVTATVSGGEITLSWSPVAGATAYTIYWSTSPGVTKLNSTRLTDVASPYVHTGLSGGETYYYVVAAVNAGEESPVSLEVSATPGKYGWGVAQLLETDDTATHNARDPEVASNDRGDVISVWTQPNASGYHAIWARRYTALTGWEAAQSITATGIVDMSKPQVAMHVDGSAIAIWRQYSGTAYNVWASHFVPGTGWSAPENIENNPQSAINHQVGLYPPRLTLDGQGNAIAIWRQYDGVQHNVLANRFVKGTGWGTAQTIEQNAGEVHHIEIAADAQGNALTVWRQHDGVRINIWANEYSVATAWATAALVETDDLASAGIPSVAMNTVGNAIVVWDQSDTWRYNGWARRYQVGTGWEVAEPVDNTTLDVNNLVAAIDEGGNVMVVWKQSSWTQQNLWANRYTLGSGWGIPEEIETNGFEITSPALALDTQGNGMVVWRQQGTPKHIWANRYIAGVGWGKAQSIETTVDATGSSSYPKIVFDAQGRATAVWMRGSTQTTVSLLSVWANRFEMFTEPPVADAGVDQSAYEGTTVTLDGSASTDLNGTIVAYTWSQVGGAYIPGSPTGMVGLTGADTAAPSFVAPEVDTPATYLFALTVTDSEGAIATDLVTITVVDSDADVDGMDDAWEMQYFGTLDRDGTGDFDGDGFLDLQESQQGTNPTALTPPTPAGMQARPSDGEVFLSWGPVNGATHYNLYWSTSPGVTKATGTLITGVTSPYVHTGLTNGLSYYYIVTAVNASDESAVSAEAGAQPDKRAWGVATQIETNDTGSAEFPQVVVDAAGNALAVWQHSDASGWHSLYANRYDGATGQWDTPVLIEGFTGDAFPPRIAMNDNGEAVVVWVHMEDATYDYNLYINRYIPGVGWGTPAPVEVLSGDAYSPQVAISASGQAAIVWLHFDSSTWEFNVYANLYDPGIGWSAPALIGPTTSSSDVAPQVAMDGAGNVWALWRVWDGSQYSLYASRYDRATGQWGTATLIESLTGNVNTPRLAMDAGGDAMAVWSHFNETTFAYDIYANRYDGATGLWGTPVALAALTGADAYKPQIAMNANGQALVVWQYFDNAAWTYDVYANHYDPATGQWGTPVLIEAGAGTADPPQVTIDDRGNALAVWGQQDDSLVNNIYANRYDGATGQWGTPALIETSGPGDARRPQIATNAIGDTVAVWQQANGMRDDIWANHYLPGN